MSSFPAVYVRVKPISLLCCNLCGKICDCSDDLVMHFAKHFAPGVCLQCNQHLVEVGDQIYHLQFTTSCEREKPNNCSGAANAVYDIKTEPEIEIHEKNVTNDSPIPKDISEYSHDGKLSDDLKWPDYPDETDFETIDNELQPGTSKMRKPRSKVPKKPRTKRLFKNARQYECYICRKSIEYLPPLQRHIRTHYEGGPTCEICGKEFSEICYLRAHMQLHSEHKQFICTYCGKAFHKRANMEGHIICHTGEKNHKCEVCGKWFGRAASLHQHRRVHTGEKPYKCEIENCDRAYMFKIDLKRHLYGAHGIFTKKFECKVCGKILPENKLLVAHMRTH